MTSSNTSSHETGLVAMNAMTSLGARPDTFRCNWVASRLPPKVTQPPPLSVVWCRPPVIHGPKSEAFLQELWNAEIPRGKSRYFNSMLYFMSLLHCSGRFQAFY